MKDTRTKVFFDAFPLATERISGIGHLIIETIRALDKDLAFQQRYQLVLIAPKGGFKNIAKLGFKNVKLRAVPTKGRVWSALVLFRLLPPADLFFGKGVYIFGNYTTWPLLLSKSITYIHDLNFLSNPDTVKPKTYKVLSKNIPLWIKRATKIVTISDFSKREIEKYYGLNPIQIETIHCGVDRKTFFPRSTKEIDRVRVKYGVGKKYVMFLSNIEPRKNVARLLEAYEKLSPKYSEYELLLVGAEGWLNDSVRKKISRLQKKGLKIIWPQVFVPDAELPALLSGAKLLVHPALYEGFGISPLQAMACGTPVLVSNTTSLPEVAGDQGVYVDPISAADINKNLELMLAKDKSSELQKKLIARASIFTWEASGQKLTKIIDSLII